MQSANEMKEKFSIKDFASSFRVTEKAARKRLYEMEADGKVVRIGRGYPIMYTESFFKGRWHDPFNKCQGGDYEKIVAGVLAQYVKRKG
jgi:DeoR/GlpR family transcriptional regulator of sugar metabolism